MSHPDEELVRRAYAAFAEGDLDTLDELLADEVVFHQAGDNPMAGEYRGKQEVLAWLSELAVRSGGTFRLEVHDVIANDDHVVVLGRPYGRRGAHQLDGAPVAHVFHAEDGSISEYWGLHYDQPGLDQFWS